MLLRSLSCHSLCSDRAPSPLPHLPLGQNIFSLPLPLHHSLFVKSPLPPSHPTPEPNKWEQEGNDSRCLPTERAAHPQPSRGSQDCQGMLPRLLLGTHGTEGNGPACFSQRPLLTLTLPQHPWKGFPEEREALCRIMTQKQSIHSLWPQKAPLQVNCSNEIIQIILADFALK